MERIKKKSVLCRKCQSLVFVDSLSVVSIRLLPQYDDFIYSCSCTLFVRVRARDHGGLNARLISGYEHVIN